VPAQEIAFQLHERRMHHQGLTLVIGDVVVRTSGSVGVDDESLQMIAEVPIREEWVANDRILAGLRGQTLKFPVTGTLRQPKVDGRVLDQLSRSLIQGAAG